MLYILINFLIIFIIIFIFNYLVKLKRIKKKKYNKIEEMNYILAKFKLKKNKINYKKEIFFISLINSFIISLTSIVVIKIKGPLFLRLAAGFVIIFLLIYAFYEIYGRNLKKKEGK